MKRPALAAAVLVLAGGYVAWRGVPRSRTAAAPPSGAVRTIEPVSASVDSSCCSPGEATRDGAALREAPADLEFTTLEGRRLRLGDFRGRVVLLNVWASWCPPCRAEIPDLVRLHEAYRRRGFTVVGVSVDEGAGAERTVREFVRAYGIPYPTALAPTDLESRLGRIEGIPRSFLIDRSGRIVRDIAAARSYAEFERDLLPLL